MNYTQQALDKAKEGGYEGLDIRKGNLRPEDLKHNLLAECLALNDPLFWSSLCNSLEIYGTKCYPCAGHYDENDLWWNYGEPCYRHVWHSFVDHILDGNPIDDFFKNLINNKPQ